MGRPYTRSNLVLVLVWTWSSLCLFIGKELLPETKTISKSSLILALSTEATMKYVVFFILILKVYILCESMKTNCLPNCKLQKLKCQHRQCVSLIMGNRKYFLVTDRKGVSATNSIICLRQFVSVTALRKWGGAHQTSNHLLKPHI